MKFLPLFRVQVRHEYYVDAICTDLRFEPTLQTKQLLARYQLILKPQADGLSIWAQADTDSETTLIDRPYNEIFTFHLSVENPDFALITDLQSFAGKTDPIYRGIGKTSNVLELQDRESFATQTVIVPAGESEIKFNLGGNPLALDGDESKALQKSDFSIIGFEDNSNIVAYDEPTKTVTIKTLKNERAATVGLRYRIKPVRDKKSLATLELRYDESVPESQEIRFNAKSDRWAYYLISDKKGDFSVSDSQKSLVFSKTELYQSHAIDPLAEELLLQFPRPTFQQVRFLSEEPVACSSIAREGIELQLDGEKVFVMMPNPSIHQTSRIKQKIESDWQDQDTLYQVVKHFNPH